MPSQQLNYVVSKYIILEIMERDRPEETKILQQFREAIPFLNQIPDNIYFNLDPYGFYFPRGQIAQAREDLEKRLNHYVMTYDRDVFNLKSPLEEHLCAVLAGAPLTDNQLQTLFAFEKKFRTQRVSFVAYQKPLEIIDPYQSWLYPIYLEKRLIDPLKRQI